MHPLPCFVVANVGEFSLSVSLFADVVVGGYLDQAVVVMRYVWSLFTLNDMFAL